MIINELFFLIVTGVVMYFLYSFRWSNLAYEGRGEAPPTLPLLPSTPYGEDDKIAMVDRMETE